MTQATKLTQQDLKIYPSQRLTDTPDGGGLMVGTPLTGADNELFSPISDVDRTMGAFDSRLVYAGVLRPDTTPLFGAHFIISEPPKAKNVSYLAFPANGYGDTRQAIMPRVENYSAPTIESPMTLLGTQMRGSRLLQAYQSPNMSVPVTGQRYCLRYVDNGVVLFDFVRVESVSHQLRSFSDGNGEFIVRVIKIVTQDVLKRDFVGVNQPERKYVNSPVKLLETQVSDAAKYYGVRPLAVDITAQSASVWVDSIYEQLVPTSTVETAHVDAMAGGWPIWIETAPKRLMVRNHSSAQIHLDTSVLPGSIEMTGWTDDGQGQLIRGDEVLQVDYAYGTITGAKNFYIDQLYAIPAALYANYCYSSIINIDETNQGTEFAPLLRPKPARGSVRVGFRSMATWYWLVDFGDYVLRDERGVARGRITKDGSCVISLPALPDIGSKIIVSFAPQDFYKAFDGGEAGQVINPVDVNPVQRLPESPKNNFKPGTVRLAWDDGGGKTATDNGSGSLTGGGASGVVDYAAGQIYPKGINGAEITLTAQQYSGIPEQKAVAVTDGGSEMTLIVGPCQPGGVSVNMVLERKEANGYTIVLPVPRAGVAFASGGGGGHSVGGTSSASPLKVNYVQTKRSASNSMSFHTGSNYHPGSG